VIKLLWLPKTKESARNGVGLLTFISDSTNDWIEFASTHTHTHLRRSRRGGTIGFSGGQSVHGMRRWNKLLLVHGRASDWESLLNEQLTETWRVKEVGYGGG
jgi:hypothetical protein